MSRSSKWLFVSCVAFVAAVATAGAVSAASSSVQLGPARVAVNATTYRFAVNVGCPAGAERCAGILGIETAAAIKPYSSRPAKRWSVGAFPFSVAPGATQAAPARVYGGALAQLLKTGSVQVRVTARLTTGATAGSRVVTLVLKRA